MNKLQLITTALLLMSGSALASSDSATYAQLFHDTIINSAEVNGDLSKAEAYTDCHMTALGAFSRLIRQSLLKKRNF